MQRETNIFDEWTSDIEPDKKEAQKPNVERQLWIIQGMIRNGNMKAKNELQLLLRNNTDRAYDGQIKGLLTLFSRHTTMVLLLSIPAIAILHIFYASIFALVMNLVVLVPKWYPKFEMNESMSDFLSELSILLVVGPTLAVGWAKRKYPTLIKPAIPWLLIIPIAILFTGLLISIYDFLFVIEYMIIHGHKVAAASVVSNLLSFIGASSIAKVPLASAFKHPLTSIALLGSIVLAYYGSLGKTTEEILENCNLLEKI